MNKHVLRQWAKNIRKTLNINQLSIELSEALRNTKVYTKAKNFMLYYPLSNEINLLSLLEDKSKNFYLPRIEGDSLVCCPYKTFDILSKSRFNTFEPVCEPCLKTDIDVVIVPALACDKHNYRLGLFHSLLVR